MIAIDVELLTGRYVATSFSDRRQPEWPPHPARLFSALVATAHEHDELSAASRRALEWLEQQGAPRVHASDAGLRVVVTSYVPENSTRILGDWTKHEEKLLEARAALEVAERSGDAKELQRRRRAVDKAKAKLGGQIARLTTYEGKYNPSAAAEALEMLPEQRGKQARTLPSVTPFDPRVRYEWPDARPDQETREALAELARRLVRLGHSSSLVACRVSDAAASANQRAWSQTWVPAKDGGANLRIVAPGQLDRLERAYARHRGVDPRVLPAHHQGYRSRSDAGRQPLRSVFGEWLVLREIAPEGGRRLGLQLTRTEDVTKAVRASLFHHADDPLPAALSGHSPDDGHPLERPHVAFVPLPDVGSRYSSGSLLGVAILLPRDIAEDDRAAVLRAVGRWERDGLRLLLGRAGLMLLERVVDVDPRKTLDPDTWTPPSLRWASVTPVALDQNPGDLSARDPGVARRAAERAEKIVAGSCERIGLPRPEWVQVMRRSLFDAAPESRRFMPYPRNGRGLRRVCVHVELLFEVPVAGPILLGAGRYFGLGLCRPR